MAVTELDWLFDYDHLKIWSASYLTIEDKLIVTDHNRDIKQQVTWSNAFKQNFIVCVDTNILIVVVIVLVMVVLVTVLPHHFNYFCTTFDIFTINELWLRVGVQISLYCYIIIHLLSHYQEVEQLFHKQNSNANPNDGVVAPEIHCPHQTRFLFCSDTSPMND